MYRRSAASAAGLLRYVGLAIIVLGSPVSAAFAQTTASVDQQFAAYHARLSGAANDLLAAPAHPAPSPPPEVRERAEITPGVLPTANESFRSAFMRVQRLRPLLDGILREEGVPTDLAAIVLVESGGRPTALSPKGALGLWQLMPETARRYGLSVTPRRDERLDLGKSTRAAARYLRDLHAQFGDWKLAFAAYNTGEQNVARAIARTGSRDFARLAPLLARETLAYVPAVLAAQPLFANASTPNGPMLLAARNAHIVYATAKLEN